MGQKLTGNDSRAWCLHAKGFAASKIAGLVGIAEERVRDVTTGVRIDDKLSAKPACGAARC